MKYEFWFVVGSQFLYGPEVLETVAARAAEMAAELSRALPFPLVCKVTAKTAKEISDVVKEANYDDACAGGVIAGYWKDAQVQKRLGDWMRAAVGAAVSRSCALATICGRRPSATRWRRPPSTCWPGGRGTAGRSGLSFP